MPRGKYPIEKRRGLKKYGLRKCLLCNKVLELSGANFFANRTARGCSGFGWHCKECSKIKNRKYYGFARLKRRFDFLKKFNFTCQYCGRKAPEVVFHIDHILPLSKGGSSNEDNLLLACDECNLGKGNKIIEYGTKENV